MEKVISVRVSEDIYHGLSAEAKTREMGLSTLANQYIEEGLTKHQEERTTGLVAPEIKRLFTEHLTKMERSHTRLLARAAIEVGAVRRLVLHLMEAAEVATAEEVREQSELAWHLSQQSLRKPLEGLAELVEDMKRNNEES